MERKSHYFWAVKLPDETKQLIFEKMEEKKEFFPFQRWVHKEDYHITLAFLGFAEQEEREWSVKLIEQAVQNKTGFPLVINHIGVFGSRNSPRVFWAGTGKEERLIHLRSLVYEACENAGFSLDKRAFAPHITLARKWNGNVFHQQSLIEHNPFQEQEIHFPVKEVVLYRTKIGSVPKYEPVTTLFLTEE